jgi:putative ABC transport system substrate-binding protein
MLLLVFGLLLGASPAAAQPAPSLPRVGILCVGAGCPSLPMEVSHPTFLNALQELGHVDGKTIEIDLRGVGDRRDQLPGLAAGLIRRKVAVIVALGTSAALAAARASRTVPIVMVDVANAVEVGLVATLARPGGNVTGISVPGDRLAGKRLQLLREAAPRVGRVALLWNPDEPGQRFAVKYTEAAARSLGMELRAVEIRSTAEVTTALSAVSELRAEGLVVLEDWAFVTRRPEILQYALRNRLPSIGPSSQFAAGGGLMAYGESRAESFRRAAPFVDRILRGRKPAELPVEEPVRYELVVNRGAAGALGLTLPQSILVQADRVID